MFKAGLIATLSLPFAAAVAFAQVDQDSLKPDARVVQLTPLIVTVPVPYITRGGASALAVRPDSLRLGPAVTVDRVVRELPFIQVRNNARGEAYFALRGSSFDAREVAVLVDGLPVSLGFDHRADLALLPATGAASLTVVRGIPALLYGPNVLGGVVEMTMSEAADHPSSTTLNSGFDHTGGYALTLQSTQALATGSARLQLRGGGGYRETDGFPLPGEVTEPVPFADQDVRLNSDRMQRDGFITLRYQTNAGSWLSLSGMGYSGSRGTPAELVGTARFWRYPSQRRALGAASAGLGARRLPWGGAFRLEGSVGYDVAHTELNAYADRSYSIVQDHETDDDRNITARLLATQTAAGLFDFSGALTYADVQRDEVLGTSALRYGQRVYSAALESGVRTTFGAGSTVRLHGGIAYDKANTPSSADKPEVEPMQKWGARIGFTATTARNRLLVHGGIGQRARFPSLRELYSGALRMFEPNPDLQPEVLIASEIGSTYQLGQATRLQAVVFHHRIEDAIVRTTTPQRRVKRVNRDETVSTGLELLAVAVVRHVTMSADVTAQTVEARDPTADREFRPEYQPKFAGGLRVRTPLPLRSHLDVNARVVGAQYCLNPDGSYSRLERSERADVQLSRAWQLGTRSIDAGIAIDNVADSAIYDQCGLPQPGRLLRFRLTLR